MLLLCWLRFADLVAAIRLLTAVTRAGCDLEEQKAKVEAVLQSCRDELEEATECGICNELFDDNARARTVLTPCGHSMCADCVEKWVTQKENGTCPSCSQVPDATLRVFG